MSNLGQNISGNNWSYYPLEAEGLKDAILAQAAFVSLSEASLFASAMVRVVADQAKMIKALQERLDGMLQ